MLVASYPEADVLYQVVDKPYARVKTSLEVYGTDRLTHNELQSGGINANSPDAPDAWRHNPLVTGGKPDFVSMTEDIQHWLFRINLERVLGKYFDSEADYRAFWQNQLAQYKRNRENGSIFIKWFNTLFKGDRFITNFAGVERNRNYIAQENLNEDFPKYFNVLTGDYVGVLDDPDRIASVAGVKCRPFKCINASLKNYRDFHPFTTPEYFDQPAVSGREGVYDKAGWHPTEYFMRVFWQFEQKVVLPVMLPQDSVTWIDASIVELGGVPLSKPTGKYSVVKL